MVGGALARIFLGPFLSPSCGPSIILWHPVWFGPWQMRYWPSCLCGVLCPSHHGQLMFLVGVGYDSEMNSSVSSEAIRSISSFDVPFFFFQVPAFSAVPRPGFPVFLEAVA